MWFLASRSLRLRECTLLGGSLLNFLLPHVFSNYGAFSSGLFYPCPHLLLSPSFIFFFFFFLILSHFLHLFSLYFFIYFIVYFYPSLSSIMNQFKIEIHPFFLHLFNKSRKMNYLYTIICQGSS